MHLVRQDFCKERDTATTAHRRRGTVFIGDHSAQRRFFIGYRTEHNCTTYLLLQQGTPPHSFISVLQINLCLRQPLLKDLQFCTNLDWWFSSISFTLGGKHEHHELVNLCLHVCQSI
ncbi:unnamed protein product [Cuscuta campestris]|uniref:Uncharacterized protein n=1 Tax=Cuscuta campestris TaxID=132261 RepID=A0A484LB98_9ASTE|nr:unnamed protein product [Cuscuta campestris]